MSIYIKEPHFLPVPEVQQRLGALTNDLANQYQLQVDWAGLNASFASDSVTGTIAIADDAVTIEIEPVGVMAQMAAGTIKERVQAQLRRALSGPSTFPTTPPARAVSTDLAPAPSSNPTPAPAAGPAPSTGASSAPSPTLRRNDHGPAVTALQQQLQARGYSPGALDGSFGPGTQAAVKAFQRDHQLDPDGVVGPRTRAALFADASDAAPAPQPAAGPQAAATPDPAAPAGSSPPAAAPDPGPGPVAASIPSSASAKPGSNSAYLWVTAGVVLLLLAWALRRKA